MHSLLTDGRAYTDELPWRCIGASLANNLQEDVNIPKLIAESHDCNHLEKSVC